MQIRVRRKGAHWGSEQGESAIQRVGASEDNRTVVQVKVLASEPHHGLMEL